MLLRRAALPALRSTIPILHLFNRYGINRSLASTPEAACFDVDGNPKPTSVTGTTRKERKGLYGYDVLETPQGFRAFVQMAIERSEDLISQIKDVPPSMETIRLMDEISDTVCSVVDAAELCRNTHPDREYVDEANQASMKLYSYLHQLNTNSTLYDAVVKTEASNSLTTEEAKRAAKTLRTDFERGGIHLPAEKLDRVTELNMKITGLGRQFAENVINEQGYIDVYPAAKLPNHVHPMLVPIYRSSDGTIRTSLKKGESLDGVQAGMRVSTESGVVSAVLKWVSDPKIRKQVYIAGNTASKSNLHVLDQLIAARHEVAEILGYKTYAEFATAPTMAGSPEVVMSFLHDLIGKTRKKADEEMSMLKEFSRVDTINAWDEVYYSGLFKAHIQDLDAKVVASYFPVEQCLNGLKIIVKSLFGASFEKVPMFPGEAWHPHVQKWALQHPDEGTLGYMFLDLYARKGKFPGCAHFALKGGRRISEADYQLPVIALVCNFSKPNSCAPPMLQHWELENLFHEFGHALHSLLSRTDYQHFSGTRTVLDFAETPSNLFEYYAWDYRVLKTFARHYSSGEVIPEKMVASLNRAKDMLPVTALTRQVLYSVIDQKLFGEKHIAAKDTTQIIAELKHSYTNQKHVEGTHWQTTFNHLVNYGAGYYSYLYAKSIAANIWHKVCVENPLCLSTGNVLRKGFLQHGGARDPTSMIRECLGDQFLISDQLGGVRPCINQLLTELKVHKSSTLFDMMWDNHDFSTELSPKISENDEKVGE